MSDVTVSESGDKKGGLALLVKGFEQELEIRTATFAQALPEHVPVAKFKRNLLMAVINNPDLLSCYRPSLFQAAMTSASLGLLLDPSLGHGYILPFRDNKAQRTLAQFIPGYRGYIHLARQSGELESVSAYEVCQKDEFSYELGLHDDLKHKPADGERGPITHAYCIVRYKDGGHHIEVMTKADIDRIRARSKSSNSPAWRDDYPMMARKTVIRRAAKYMPLSVQRAAALDAAYDEGRAGYIDGGSIVIENNDDGQTDPESIIEKPAAGKLARFEEGGASKPTPEPAAGAKTETESPHNPVTGEVLAPRDSKVADQQNAAEIENGGDTTQGTDDPFWSGETYTIVPQAQGRGFKWPAWHAEMMRRISETRDTGELGKLDADNKEWLGRYMLALPDNAGDVRKAIAVRAEQLMGPPEAGDEGGK